METTQDAILPTLLRRWRISVPILLLTAVAAFVVEESGEATYRAEGTYMLATPAYNPDARASGLADAGDLVARYAAVGGEEAWDAGSDREGRTVLDVLDDNTVRVSSTGTNTREAEDSATAAVDWLHDELEQAQPTVADQEEMPEWRLLTPDIRGQPAENGGYEAVAVMWLDELSGVHANPYSAGDTTARILEITLNSEARAPAIDAAIGDAVSWSVARGMSRRPTTIEITTTGSEPDAVMAGYDLVMAELVNELDDRQARAGVAARSRIGLDTLAGPGAAEPLDDGGPSTRTLAVLVLGIGGAIAASAVVDVRQRARGRVASNPPSPGGDARDRPIAPPGNTPLLRDTVYRDLLPVDSLLGAAREAGDGAPDSPG